MQMLPPKEPEGIEFDGPATYRIVVQGALSAEWSPADPPGEAGRGHRGSHGRIGGFEMKPI